MSGEGNPVLVTGAAGFIGSHLVEALLGRGERVIGIDNFDPLYDPELKRRHLACCCAHERSSCFEFVEADIRDAPAMASLMRRVRPSGVIHLAARAGVRPSVEDPVSYASVNVTGTSVLLDAASRLREELASEGVCARFVMASSSSVYGNNRTVPFAETHDVNEPISPYASTKRACELLGWTQHHLTGLPVACLRFFTVYGPRQRPDLAIHKFLRRIAAGEPITMYGDGSSSRDYTFIDDIIAGVLSAWDRVDQHGYRVWNLGGQDPVSLSRVIELASSLAGRPARIERAPMQPGDVERTFADLTRSGAELGYEPTTSFEDGMRRQWAWMQEQASG